MAHRLRLPLERSHHFFSVHFFVLELRIHTEQTDRRTDGRTRPVMWPAYYDGRISNVMIRNDELKFCVGPCIQRTAECIAKWMRSCLLCQSTRLCYVRAWASSVLQYYTRTNGCQSGLLYPTTLRPGTLSLSVRHLRTCVRNSSCVVNCYTCQIVSFQPLIFIIRNRTVSTAKIQKKQKLN